MKRRRNAAPRRLAVLATGEASREENRLEHTLQMTCMSYCELQSSVDLQASGKERHFLQEKRN
jgi:hypothetical protein